MNEMEFYQVQKADLLELQEISRQTFFDTFGEVNTHEDMNHYLEVNLSLEQLTLELSNPSTSFYFAKNGKKILAYLKLNEAKAQTENRDIPSLEIERIYVRKENQNRGVGQFLLDHSIQITKDKQLKLIWLGVWEHNVSAIRFYERNQFKFFGKHSFMLGSDEQTDLLMELKLD
ncbi:MAG: GNAT family N-acetyltransferase [Crocinitomicaceae bacterium]|nr:GNAT family N-acetyltransferase [Crocinitomicaceae bacterium]MBP6032710.1 GNAT family N-acetyltransferase [Crocinitomicaceae bacterium]